MLARFRSILLVALLAVAAPAYGQLTIEYPEHPVKEGQTLLEWANPPILSYDIAEDKRGNLSSCNVTSEMRLDAVVTTCWPILQIAKLYTRLNFASGEPSGDQRAHKRRALAYGDQIIALIGEPEWPLERYYLMKTYESMSFIYRDFEQFDNALAATENQIKYITGTVGYDLEFRLAFARFKRGQHLLKLNRQAEARAGLEENYALLRGRTGYKNALPISDHNSAIASDAIRSGDVIYAEQLIDRYLADASAMAEGLQFGILRHIDLKIYLLARKKDIDGILTWMDTRMAESPSYSKCPAGDIYFPSVLAPLHTHPRIAAKLASMDCTARDLGRIDSALKNGIKGYRDGFVLPPQQP